MPRDGKATKLLLNPALLKTGIDGKIRRFRVIQRHLNDDTIAPDQRVTGKTGPNIKANGRGTIAFQAELSINSVVLQRRSIGLGTNGMVIEPFASAETETLL
ncbi:MAG: hypothetical protein GDA36_11515 [Rhodobacteraceae bacterium]|nr:hypothetical protein [Paracoccaceae bacterium]